MMKKFKCAFIGAGSVGFTRKLVRDLLSVPAFSEIRLCFQDISEANLDMVKQLVQRDIEHNHLKIVIEATTDQRTALRDAKYIFCTPRIGGLEAFKHDVNIPLKYGIDQCVGDTLCAGGLLYAQRGIPFILDLCRDIREVGAEAPLLLNYANPMAMLTWAANLYGKVNTVGLCHGVQNGMGLIANLFGIEMDSNGRPVGDVEIICAGINHQTWYTSVMIDGVERKDDLLAAFEAKPEICAKEKVRVDVLRRFGYFSTESNGHLSEYLPWYRKRPDEIKDWIDLGNWINGETGGYLRICTEGRDWFTTDFPNWMKEEPHQFAEELRSNEHGSWIVEALETGRIYRGHFNRINAGVISNLPSDCVIEAPGYVDRCGIQMTTVGDLPLGCAAICNQSISVQRMGLEAAVSGDVELLKQALLLDPLVGAVCNPPEVWQMADELLVALAEWMPQYEDAIPAAKARLADQDHLLPTQTDYAGAARIKVKTVEEMALDRAAATAMAGESNRGEVKE